MCKLRLIESYTWLMLNVEWYLLEELCEELSIQLLKNNSYKELAKYLYIVNDIMKLNKVELIDILGDLSNQNRDAQFEINEIVLEHYSEIDLIILIANVISLLEFLNINKTLNNKKNDRIMNF